jgi:hypothetical protein
LMPNKLKVSMWFLEIMLCLVGWFYNRLSKDNNLAFTAS